jgi:hypothetical protein
MKTIRFAGLVRLANGVQRELCRAVPHGRREELREQVHRAVSLVERTLGAHGASLKAVPGPTRRAYEFLRTIDFDQIELGADDRSAPAQGQVVVRGLIARVEQIGDDLAQLAGQPDSQLGEAASNIARVHSRIEAHVCRANIGFGALTSRSREHLAWLRYFADEPRVQDYVAAVRRARSTFESVAPADRWPRPIIVHFRPTHSVFRARAESGRTRVLLPTPMITLDDIQFIELARALFGRRSRKHNAALHSILLAKKYQQVRLELEALSGIVEETRGMVHDLAESFDRVNSTYFGNTMPRPRLTWNRSITAGKFGHYHYATDTVMISRALDRPHVPSFVVDHVMHHELLHKKHGLRWHRGRSHAHTSEFRRDEMVFERFREADQYLQALATGTARSKHLSVHDEGTR